MINLTPCPRDVGKVKPVIPVEEIMGQFQSSRAGWGFGRVDGGQLEVRPSPLWQNAQVIQSWLR